MIQMKLYAIYKDGALYKASYEQNTPFYSTKKGAEAAIKSQTNRRSIPITIARKGITEKEIQDYLDIQKERFEIREFQLGEGKVIK